MASRIDTRQFIGMAVGAILLCGLSACQQRSDKKVEVVPRPEKEPEAQNTENGEGGSVTIGGGEESAGNTAVRPGELSRIVPGGEGPADEDDNAKASGRGPKMTATLEDGTEVWIRWDGRSDQGEDPWRVVRE